MPHQPSQFRLRLAEVQEPFLSVQPEEHRAIQVPGISLLPLGPMPIL